MRLKDIMPFQEFANLPFLDQVAITSRGNEFELLSEGKWTSGRFERNIRIDQPTHGVGQTHAHILGRKGDQLGVVNFDGSSSHGTKMRLHKKDAEALRGAGASIPKNNIIEWVALADQPQMLFG